MPGKEEGWMGGPGGVDHRWGPPPEREPDEDGLTAMVKNPGDTVQGRIPVVITQDIVLARQHEEKPTDERGEPCDDTVQGAHGVAKAIVEPAVTVIETIEGSEETSASLVAMPMVNDVISPKAEALAVGTPFGLTDKRADVAYGNVEDENGGLVEDPTGKNWSKHHHQG